MSNSVKVDVQGFQELADKIKKLGDDKDKRREGRLILRQIAKPTLLAAQSLAPVSKERHYSRGKYIIPGTLKKSLGVINVRTDNPSIAIGPRAKNKKFDGWYGHFVHEGHEYFTSATQNTRFSMVKKYSRTYFVKKRKKESEKSIGNRKRKSKKQKARLRYIGRARMTKPQPFLDKAYEQTKGKVTQDAEKQFAAFIQRRINRLSK
ncbi:HK97-gp10 family putative phage morphogenesis protein [Myroides odoratimimus]|uniref:HK97-gp10 family putative phage morphogenesis protein n=1 Tax=Myroides odoratimimus TaxID=76832 RepID=UPI00257636E4|nr:HK97-gp10 family putative phage morphogenesis protein [Myroides odoratimimus]MDM1535050.1 hypothetical protein [Myroides odoratimimus]MDM1674192.1 hypothetical protein [Myroides odoratimimus]